MKILALVLGLGCCQAIISGFGGLLPAPYEAVRTQTPPVEEKWHCSRCDHSNYDWTSICGYCGKSRGGDE